jgi:hypothetical protein
MFRCAFLAAIAVVATTSAPLAQTQSGGSRPATPSAAVENSNEAIEDPQTGDHWTYELRDEISGVVKSTFTHTITDVSDSEISIRVNNLGNANTGYLTFDRSWDLTNNGVWRYSPNDGTGIRLPLAVGKSWAVKSTDTNSTAGVSFKRSGTAKVVAQENITTRAGTFDTFKIETSYQLQNANDPTKRAQFVIQIWYAPLIDHWVKRSVVSRSDGVVREKSTVELVEYGRR